jgi:UDP-N-acetylglucosamine--N-acetylmuramyl-(pentapeptide) pyrophosphoryl-undecaprenol N-acetylglucosamine transferase
VPDIEPGLAIKTIARYCDRIALTVDESRQFFPNHPSSAITGYPLRPDLDRWTIAEAKTYFAYQEQLPVLLVLGGSRGARSINQAVVASLPELLEEMQVIHITGRLDWPMVEQARANLNSAQLNRYRPYPFIYDEIGAALTLADLALTRAGASTLGELTTFGLPAILVPYPYAWRYQRTNASYLVRHGAALQIEDSQLAEQGIPMVRQLMADREQLQRMSQAMHALANPAGASRIASLLNELAASSKPSGSLNVPNPTD